MTGYGRGKASLGGGQQVTVEISSVNRRQNEIALSLPRGWQELEPRLRDAINAHISRGRITAVVGLHQTAGRARNSINIEAARHYHRELLKLRAALESGEPITLQSVLSGPGVLVEQEPEIDPEKLAPPCLAALDQAMRQLLLMRKKEGAALAADLRKRARLVKSACAAMEKRVPEVMAKHRAALLARALKAGIELNPNDERILKELVFFADRSDISEELTRLRSHLDQFIALLAKDEPAGRTLDFILQEMNREINTIGSKANDIDISRTVVDVKTELEKMREQSQNIE
jgi:uncharacterized protein (TIGR00255 family)